MTFLNPAVLIGLAAATIPILIHLLNLRKLKKIEFSTLHFLKELQKNKIRRVKLKQWLLLALRVMIILLIVTALARPTLEGVSIGGTTSAAKTSVVFILDDTFSMSVVDQNGSLFNLAKQTIKKLLTQLQEGDEASLILISGDESDEQNFSTNINSISDRLNELKISDASGNINSSLLKAADLISKSKNFNKEIYLLTDFQKDRIYEEKNISDMGQILNGKVYLYSFNYAKKDIYNISIDDLKVITGIFEKEKPIKFEAVVNNHSSQPVSNQVVSLFIDGERSAQQSVDLNAGESKTIQLEGVAKNTGFINITVETEDDDINQDNKRFTSVFIPEKLSVLLLSEIPGDAKFVKLALKSSEEFGNIDVTELPANRLLSTQLKNFDVLVFIGNNLNIGADELKLYVSTGGGLIFFPSSLKNLLVLQQSLNTLGLPQPSSLANGSNDPNSSVDIEKVDFNHPVFQDIFQNEEKKKIESPEIYTYYKYSSRGKGKNIISLIDGSSFLTEYSLEKGKIFFFNTAPVLGWSDFPLKSIFTPLIYKSVIYISAKDQNGTKYFAGTPLNLNVSQRTLPQVRIVKPDKSEDLINLNGNASDFITYPHTYEEGNYLVYSGDKLLNIVSVNTDPLESNTNYISDNEFNDYLKKINFSGSYVKISKDEDPVKKILQARFGSELWRYFLLAAILLALLEMTIARSAKKELVEVTE